MEVEPSGLLEDADYIRSVCLTTTTAGDFGFTYAASNEMVSRKKKRVHVCSCVC